MQALAHYDERDYDAALSSFGNIADTSKILFNCGVIYATLGQHGKAVDCYQRAVQLDQYLAVAYFQQGVSNFLCGDFEEALANFNDTLLYLRGNRSINYEQLGLGFKLHSCEALFNRGLCFIYTQQKDAGMQDLIFAAREKAVPDHSVIDDAIRDRAEGYTVFSIPVGILYRPNEAKVRNLRTKDYLPRARLVAQQKPGTSHKRQLSAQDLFFQDRQHDGSWAAMNMVKPGLTSRTRQQSEPPSQRDIFPPTPPPESEKPSFTDAVPLRDLPPKLKLGNTSFNPLPLSHPDVANSAPEMLHRRHGTLPNGEDPFAISRPAVQESPLPTADSHASTAISSRSHPYSINEDPEDEAEAQADSPSDSSTSASPAIRRIMAAPSFEMMTTRRQSLPLRDCPDRPSSVPRHRLHRADSGATIAERRRAGSMPRKRAESRGRSRGEPPAMKRLRIKIHTTQGEIRFVMVEADAGFVMVAEAIYTKLGLLDGWNTQEQKKIKFRDDEGDMVTLADDEDWSMALDMARRAAKLEWNNGKGSGESETGRLELWIAASSNA